MIATHPVETVSLAALKPHPRNYREHPADQLEHLCRSLEEHGVYRNVVVAKDGTILAGHGVVLAAQQLGMDTLGVVRLPIAANSKAALKVLAADNEIEHLAEQDDRALSELLKEIAAGDPLDLLGTGYDGAMLANLAFVTRPAAEIADHDAAAHWAGMPNFEPAPPEIQLNLAFESEAAREAFASEIGLIGIEKKSGVVWSCRWPPQEREDLASLRYVEADHA